MSELNPRLEGFARESLKQGRGEWWIVDQMVKRSAIEETEARAIVARVSPALYVEFIRRRRSFLRCGLMILGFSLFCLATYGDVRHVTAYSIVGIVLGSFLTAHGWPGLKRLRTGDAPTALPGSSEGGPVRTGLSWRADPFETP
jgi:hypothetical protein